MTEEELVALGVEEFTACVGVGVSELVAEGDDVLDSEAVGLGVDVAVGVAEAALPGVVHERLSPDPDESKPAAHVQVTGELALRPADDVELPGQGTHCACDALK